MNTDSPPTPTQTSNPEEPTGNTISKEGGGGLTFWQLLGSTLAAAVGVQSRKNRERDFSQGKAIHFILMGIGFTIVFVLGMIGLVNLVLS